MLPRQRVARVYLPTGVVLCVSARGLGGSLVNFQLAESSKLLRVVRSFVFVQELVYMLLLQLLLYVRL